jgi:hypothetical protein
MKEIECDHLYSDNNHDDRHIMSALFSILHLCAQAPKAGLMDKAIQLQMGQHF